MSEWNNKDYEDYKDYKDYKDFKDYKKADNKWPRLAIVLAILGICTCVVLALSVGGAATYFSLGSSQELVAYFPFDGHARDESGYQNHGVVFGATRSPDRFGRPDSAYTFDGVDDFIALPDNLDLLGSDFTLSAWIKPNDYGVKSEVSPSCARTVLSYRFRAKQNDNPLNSGATIFIREEGGCGGKESLMAQFNDTVFHYNGVTYEYDDHDWFLFSATRAKNELIIYVNGDEVTRKNVSTAAIYENGSSPHTTIGGFRPLANDTFRFPFDGQIDEVRIYNYALSPAEIRSLYLEE